MVYRPGPAAPTELPMRSSTTRRICETVRGAPPGLVEITSGSRKSDETATKVRFVGVRRQVQWSDKRIELAKAAAARDRSCPDPMPAAPGRRSRSTACET